jgi:hypothetical protein
LHGVFLAKEFYWGGDWKSTQFNQAEYPNYQMKGTQMKANKEMVKQHSENIYLSKISS